jgi:hypothetical protein
MREIRACYLCPAEIPQFFLDAGPKVSGLIFLQGFPEIENICL